jgi:hypothetical protein
MTTNLVTQELLGFTARLFEQVGGELDWHADEARGEAMVPAELAQLLGLPEIFTVAAPPQAADCSLSLASDHLDQMGRLLAAAVPRWAEVRVGELYLKGGDLQTAVDHCYTWHNARVRVQQRRPTVGEYHTWWFLASLRADDVWEDRLGLTLNAQSGAELDLLDPAALVAARLARDVNQPAPESSQPADANPWADPLPDSHANDGPPIEPDHERTWELAVEIAQRRALQMAATFLERTASRHSRDKQRLRDYYQALRRQSQTVSKRTRHVPSEEEQQARQRAVGLELQRKLGELAERYTLEARLRPLCWVPICLPVLAIELHVQRKQAARQHTIFWNPLTKAFEPMLCTRCHTSTMSVFFTNEQVDVHCVACGR